jgi:hypothetical protein
MGRRKNFFEIYKQFGHAPSNNFASPVPDPQHSTYRAAELHSSHPTEPSEGAAKYGGHFQFY